ncbi:MAG: DoxX family protein [Pseudorhodobacter sp.]
MEIVLKIAGRAVEGLDRAAPVVLPLLARIVFAGVLLVYFWASAQTKLGTGVLGLSDGAYIQIFPRSAEAFGYDFSRFTLLHALVVFAGTWAEFILPLLIVIGLATRLAALGMIGFVLVQSFVDVTGHGVGGDDLGAWFDRASGALILDQRSLWVLLLLILVAMGGGALSLDRIIRRRLGRQTQGS